MQAYSINAERML